MNQKIDPLYEGLARKVTRQELVKRSLIVLTSVLSILILAVQMYMVNEIRQSQVAAAVTGKEILHISENIEDCTTPGRPCYDRTSSLAGDSVEEVNKVVVLAIACSNRPGVWSADQISDCVSENLN